MTQALLVALITAIPPTLMAYIAWSRLTTKADEIHVLVNSNLTKVNVDLAVALDEIAYLKEVLGRK